ncbi:MAG: chemotaxis protein CheA [Planctomycetota bacterium]
MSDFDPSLMQDFLTESSELIEQLDGDLVKLESSPESEHSEILNACFRALHTIKGAASFLALSDVTDFAHVAEDALNRLRKGEIAVSTQVMDALLQSADVVRGQIEALSGGEETSQAPQDLVDRLHAIVQGSAAAAAADAGSGETPGDGGTDAGASEEADLPGRALALPPQKADLVDFMAADLKDYAGQIDEAVEQLGYDASRADGVAALVEIADNLCKTAEFFELDELTAVVTALSTACPKLDALPAEHGPDAWVRIRAVGRLIEDQADWLEKSRALSWPLDAFLERLAKASQGEALDALASEHGGSIDAVLVLDGVVEGDEQTDTSAGAAATAGADHDAGAPSGAAVAKDAVKGTAEEDPKADAGKAAGKPVAEQTIRVEVSRLESLLNLIGQLVLNKNRILGLNRHLDEMSLEQETREAFTAASGELDRLTGELQMGVMRTRMQPLAKLFDRYPRVIRDIARATGKQIDLVIDGKDTEVDKSVLESLADPLVHILRNSADHGVEMPEDRKAKGKPEKGRIHLQAAHQGSHVRVAITDDGKGLDRAVIGAKAVERGLVKPDQLTQLSDSEVFRFIFEAGFSTAKQVSELSGRGVGMDVVRSNIQKINGTVQIHSELGKGTTIEVLIPLTVAIMPAMVVGVGAHLYSVPLQSVVEIVRPEEQKRYSVRGEPVIRIRDDVLPLLDMRRRLGETGEDEGGRFAVVVAVGGRRLGLMVDRLVGQQEIVIKPLDDGFTQGGPFAGATIREDGTVSLILDVVALLRSPPGEDASADADAVRKSALASEAQPAPAEASAPAAEPEAAPEADAPADLA